jgi:hypothetical protein
MLGDFAIAEKPSTIAGRIGSDVWNANPVEFGLLNTANGGKEKMQIGWTFSLLVAWYCGHAALAAEAPAAQKSIGANSVAVNATTDAQGNESERKLVTLTVDFGDGFQKRFTNVSWSEGLTVLDVMFQAKRHKRGRLEFKQRGKAATALLFQIDDVANQGGGRRNWIYYVNKRKGDRSFAISKLEPGDEVLWRFETYQ